MCTWKTPVAILLIRTTWANLCQWLGQERSKTFVICCRLATIKIKLTLSFKTRVKTSNKKVLKARILRQGKEGAKKVMKPKLSITRHLRAQAKTNTVVVHLNQLLPLFKIKRRMMKHKIQACKTKNALKDNAEKSERPSKRGSRRKSRTGKDATILGKSIVYSQWVSNSMTNIRMTYSILRTQIEKVSYHTLKTTLTLASHDLTWNSMTISFTDKMLWTLLLDC